MTALTPDAPASRPRRGEGHTPTVQSPPEDISPLPQSQPPPPPPPPPPPQQTARATNQRRLTDEEIRDMIEGANKGQPDGKVTMQGFFSILNRQNT